MAIELPSSAKTKRSTRTEGLSFGRIPKLEFDLDALLKRGLSPVRKERLFREMHLLLHAGVDPRSVLDLVGSTQKEKNTGRIVMDIRNAVMVGSSLKAAMEEQGSFTPYEYYSVGIGEEGGGISQVFLRLADHHAERIKLQRMVKQAFAYPVLVLVITMAVVGFMMSVIVPMFAQVFSRSGTDLPALTKVILRMAETSQVWIPAVVVSVLAVIIALALLKKNVMFQEKAEWIQMKIPLFGELRRKTLLSRFCGAMAFLLRSGAPLDRAMELSKKMSGSILLERTLTQINKELIQGHSLKHGLADHKIFDQQMVAMVGVAEEVKQLDNMFDRLAERYGSEVQHKTAMMGAILEPATILVIALFVGVVLVAMYLPMFKLSTMM